MISTAADNVKQLAHFGVFSLSPDLQESIAARLADAQIGTPDIAKLFAEAKRSATTARGAVAGLANLLKQDVAVIRKVLSRSKAEPVDAIDDRAPRDVPLGSHLRNCSAGNPYGWDKPELLRGLDHDLPGETKAIGPNGLDGWNAFRQCWNLTSREKVAERASDHRRRGCSRFEVLGAATRVVPKSLWDPDEWQRAMHVGKHSEPVGGGVAQPHKEVIPFPESSRIDSTRGRRGSHSDPRSSD